MPTYTFSCVCCGDEVDVVRPVSGCAAPQVCAVCGAGMSRMYRAPQVVRDTYSRGREVFGLHAPDGSSPRSIVVGSRGELQGVMDAHERRTGAKLERGMCRVKGGRRGRVEHG